MHMKRLLFALVLFAAAFSWTNDALPDIMEARYEFAKCNVVYAEDWVGMREECAHEHGVPVFGASPYIEDLNDDLGDVEEAVEEVDRLEYGTAMLQLGLDSLDLLGAIVIDALQNKTHDFRQCVRDREEPLMDVREDCVADARELEKKSSEDYIKNEIEHAEGIMDDLEEQGVDTDGMQEVVDYGEELIDDIEPAFDSGDNTEIRALHLRHSRLVLLFRMEQMLAVVNYAEPIIEESDNDNKEEVIERGDELRDDIEDLLDECEYSATVSSNWDYGRQNLECWDDAWDLFEEFNSLRLLLLEGV